MAAGRVEASKPHRLAHEKNWDYQREFILNGDPLFALVVHKGKYHEVPKRYGVVWGTKTSEFDLLAAAAGFYIDLKSKYYPPAGVGKAIAIFRAEAMRTARRMAKANLLVPDKVEEISVKKDRIGLVRTSFWQTEDTEKPADANIYFYQAEGQKPEDFKGELLNYTNLPQDFAVARLTSPYVTIEFNGEGMVEGRRKVIVEAGNRMPGRILVFRELTSPISIGRQTRHQINLLLYMYTAVFPPQKRRSHKLHNI